MDNPLFQQMIVTLDPILLEGLERHARELDLEPEVLIKAALASWLEATKPSGSKSDQAEYQQLMRRLRYQVKKLLSSIKAGEQRLKQPAGQSLRQKWRKALDSDTLLRNALDIIATASVNLANLLSEGELPYISFAETIALASLSQLDRIRLLVYLAEFRSLDGIEVHSPVAGLHFRQLLRERPAAPAARPLTPPVTLPPQSSSGGDTLTRAINRLHRRFARELTVALAKPPQSEWLTQVEKSPWMNQLALDQPKLYQLLLYQVLPLRPAELRALDAARAEAQLAALWNLAHFGTLMPIAARA